MDVHRIRSRHPRALRARQGAGVPQSAPPGAGGAAGGEEGRTGAPLDGPDSAGPRGGAAGDRAVGSAMTLAERIDQVPDRPGVYLYKDAKAQVIYVGKAASLRSRVRSYFQESRVRDPK